MARCGQNLQIPPYTPGHDGSLPPHMAKEAAQHLFAKTTTYKNPPPIQMSLPDGEFLEVDMESLDGILQLLAETSASLTVSNLSHASNMVAITQKDGTDPEPTLQDSLVAATSCSCSIAGEVKGMKVEIFLMDMTCKS